MTMEDVFEEIIEPIIANKKKLIRLLKEKIKEFQDLTWESEPKSYPLGCGYVWNGAAVRWKRRHNTSRRCHDGYGEIMEKVHNTWSALLDFDDVKIDPVDLEQFRPLELACLAEYVLKVLKEAIKEELLKKEER